MWQGKAASKLHTHKQVDRGHPHFFPPFLCWRRACCLTAVAHKWLYQVWRQWGATGPDPAIRGWAPLRVLCSMWGSTQQHPVGEKDSMAVVASIKSSGFKGKEKRETQQLGYSSSTCPSLETCRVEVVGTSFGETGWVLLPSPTCCTGHSSIASNLCLGTRAGHKVRTIHPITHRGEGCTGNSPWRALGRDSLPGTAHYLL